MSSFSHTDAEATIVAGQIGRAPREPWCVASTCAHCFPTAIVSPSLLEDGSPFPTLAWLTCPWLAEQAAAQESAGATARWAAKAASDENLAERLRLLDHAVRSARAGLGGGEDGCASVGIAGQRDPLGVKCLHAHLALALIGMDDPIGAALLEELELACPDKRCEAWTHSRGGTEA